MLQSLEEQSLEEQSVASQLKSLLCSTHKGARISPSPFSGYYVALRHATNFSVNKDCYVSVTRKLEKDGRRDKGTRRTEETTRGLDEKEIRGGD